MKFNKWTLGLAALGVVSIGSVARAEEAQMNPLQTALASTIISGYVDTSFEWQLDPSRESADLNIPFRTSDKLNGFNLNVVKLALEKALDESEWASGYKVELLFGPDAVNYNTSVNSVSDPDFAIKQAYVALRTPVGNGIDWKMGVFDTIIGYESFDACNNPNFSRSWGYYVEPTEHTGLLGTYRINDNLSVSAGVANTLSARVNARDTENGEESYNRKTWMASVSYTIPDSGGALSGSTLYAGAVGGFNGGNEDQLNIYFGATVATPVAGLKVGAAFDAVNDQAGVDGAETWVAGVYASYQATEKMSLHVRGEYGKSDGNGLGWLSSSAAGSGQQDVLGLTGTLQYSLWNNVVSRLELRYDNVNPENGEEYTACGAYVNVIYKF